jgi:hypothetical protein
MLNEQVTTQLRVSPTLLVVSGDQWLVRHAERVAGELGLKPRVCEVAMLETEAPRLRPMLLLLPSSVYQNDAAAIDALGRDVGAVVVPCPPQKDNALALRSLVMGAISP